ncbi:MAG TPA: hypothetical protein VJV22_06505 [Acidobacteriaceae bacterium]|nr:hypothetical protein [Acidobacteriaceae bacterium]
MTGLRDQSVTQGSFALYLAALAAVAVALTTTNALLTTASILVLLLLSRLLWRPGEPPVLLFVAGFQWLQVTTLVFTADYYRKPVWQLSRSDSVETAIWLGLLGIAALTIGMRLGVRRVKPWSRRTMDLQLACLSVDRLAIAYLLLALFSAVVPYFRWQLLSIAQLLFALGSLKWVFYVLLGYATLKRRTKVWYFLAATVVEFIAGIGFFSGFKTVLFFFALVLIGVNVRLRARTVLVGASVFVVVVLTSLAWMNIREGYRSFLNKGTGQQVVLVSPTEQVAEFTDLMLSVDGTDLRESTRQMLGRLAYVEYFADVLDYVPRHHPFEGGAILWRSLRHILIPRFLDPAKPVLESDSEITMRYTGLTLASGNQGTSISIGYMAEAYVDFGVAGILVLTLLFGWLWGSMYSWLVTHTSVIATGLAFGATLLMNANQFEMAQVKLLGGMVAEFLVFALVLRFAMPRIHAWLELRHGDLVNQSRERTQSTIVPAGAAAPVSGSSPA